VLVLIADQISKAIVSSMGGYFRITLVPGLLWIVKTSNTGIAFGLFPDYTDVITWISIAVSVVLCFVPKFFNPTKLTNVATGMIIGGALGNIVDRLRFGKVVDFIELRYFPAIFNIADTFITVGGVLFVLSYIWREKKSEVAGYGEGSGLETGQIPTGEVTEMDIENDDTESNKRGESPCGGLDEETQLQGQGGGDDNGRDTRAEEDRSSS